MLTYIYVDGFRSLNHFEMGISPGLNILIGPNGSGKSNIISFFQFLSRLMRTGLGDAVSLTGGAGAFFRKVGEKTFHKEVRATVRGVTLYDDNERPARGSWHQYEYSFTILASERFDSINFSKQSLSIRSLDLPKSARPFDLPIPFENTWDVVVEISGDPPILSIPKLDPRAMGGRRLTTTARNLKVTPAEMVDIMTKELGEPALQSMPLVRLPLRPLWETRFISSDLTGGEALNINPAKVKEPEDSAREPGIRNDGSGLAATLWHVRNEPVYRTPYGSYVLASTRPPVMYWRRDRWPKINAQLQSLIQLVNPQVRAIDVVNEPFDNQLKIIVKMTGEAGEVDLPFSAMSDGTIKWASLITAILTSRAIFAIEEPENFLHPLMLIEILKLMRETTAEKAAFVVMTTHSETTVGVELFLRCRPIQMFAADASFRSFVAKLNIECWWLKDVDPKFEPNSWLEPRN